MPSNTETEEVEYESTGQELPRDMLSPRAKEMCKDSKVIWMAKRTGKVREWNVQVEGSINFLFCKVSVLLI